MSELDTGAQTMTASHAARRPDLLTVADAKAMSLTDMTEMFKDHINPGQLHFMKLLGFHKVKIETASGMYYTDQNGRKILDFFGGFRLARLWPQSSAHHQGAQGFPGRGPARDRHRLHEPVRLGAGQEPGGDSAGRPRHGFSSVPPARKPWKPPSRWPNAPPGRSVRKSSMPRTRSTARPRACCRLPTPNSIAANSS